MLWMIVQLFARQKISNFKIRFQRKYKILNFKVIFNQGHRRVCFLNQKNWKLSKLAQSFLNSCQIEFMIFNKNNNYKFMTYQEKNSLQKVYYQDYN